MIAHDPLCPWTSKQFIQPSNGWWKYCQCDLIAKTRADERATLLTEDLPTGYWVCSECGNKYETTVRYCPNGLADRHRVTTYNPNNSPEDAA